MDLWARCADSRGVGNCGSQREPVELAKRRKEGSWRTEVVSVLPSFILEKS